MDAELITIIGRVIDEVNVSRAEKIPTTDLEALTLYGEGGVFDSMQLVNFLAIMEFEITEEFDVEVSLTSEKAVSQRVSPFSRVRRLIDFAAQEIDIARSDSGVAAVAGDASVR
ncbi:hypothetical protein [Rathayibacter tanaceti]|uniref:Carrier domain-containing protein n=2 Tax=Rathayibacter tanaceti TaxID=1671680 RepID=A0A166IFM2_9MICO|nr:hypothetical protein [Rathayibacter tanaceti]KZX22304.1 hypothetical protein ACH61_00545 [Rathayibacter tanaceti]QHC56129.1 hypothetical protein GSU10_11125 [Rathayibacter tanaceti]TCO36966.1 hypothetical protein EV639_10549 [Rathayibacter tanaceti]